MLLLSCKSVNHESDAKNQTQKQTAVKSKELNIDSIVVYTAVFVRDMYYSPFNRYQDSLCCNYDSLKFRASMLKRVYRTNKSKHFIDSIGHSLSKIRSIKSDLKDSSSAELGTTGIENCQFSYKVSDLFVIYAGKRSIKIGSIAGNKRYCNLGGVLCKLPRGSNLIQLLYRYRLLAMAYNER